MSAFVTFLTMVALLLLTPRSMHAQTSITPSSRENSSLPTGRPDTGVYSGREIFVPKAEEKKTPESTATTFSDGFLRNTRHHIGFSFGAFESYTSNAIASPDGP